MPGELPADIAALLRACRPGDRVVVLTGAGMSAESGIPTFRAAPHALWADFDPAALATPRAWRQNPARVWAWYEWRRALVMAAQPNPGHLALARLQARHALTVLTQNVDDLHERAGSQDVLHLHGSLFAPCCFACRRPGGFGGVSQRVEEPLAAIEPPRCGHCGGRVRPGVLWFGETLPQARWAQAVAAVKGAALLLVVGTSAAVQPVARLPAMAARLGIPVVVINPARTAHGLEAGVRVWRASAVIALTILAGVLEESPVVF